MQQPPDVGRQVVPVGFRAAHPDEIVDERKGGPVPLVLVLDDEKGPRRLSAREPAEANGNSEAPAEVTASPRTLTPHPEPTPGPDRQEGPAEQLLPPIVVGDVVVGAKERRDHRADRSRMVADRLVAEHRRELKRRQAVRREGDLHLTGPPGAGR